MGFKRISVDQKKRRETVEKAALLYLQCNPGLTREEIARGINATEAEIVAAFKALNKNSQLMVIGRRKASATGLAARGVGKALYEARELL